MLKRIIFCGIITLICLWCLSSSQDLYGQGPSPLKSSNKPQKQLASSQKQAKIISDAAQSPVTMIPFPVTPTTDKRTTEQSKHHDNKSSSEWWLVVLNGLLVIVVFLQWRWMERQVKWMQKSAEVAEKDLVLNHGAFVFVKLNPPPIFQNPKRMSIIPEWFNSGNTRTKNMFNYVNWQVFPSGMPDDFDFPDIGSGESVRCMIPPKSSIFASDLVIPEQHIDAVINGQAHLYIWGWAEYNDIFENTHRHRTEFCNKVIVTRVTEKQVRIDFRIHTKHYGADDECMKKPIT